MEAQGVSGETFGSHLAVRRLGSCRLERFNTFGKRQAGGFLADEGLRAG